MHRLRISVAALQVSADAVPLRVGALELEAETRTGPVGHQLASDRVDHPIEEEVLDARVVVEVLEVPEVRHRARRMEVQGRGAVAGDRQTVRSVPIFIFTRGVPSSCTQLPSCVRNSSSV